MTTLSHVQPQTKLVGQTTLRFALGIVLSSLSGAMLLLSFPPYGLWFLAWVALVPGIFAQYRLLPQRWSALASALYVLFWLGPYLARLFGTEFGPFFTYLGVLIAIFVFLTSNDCKFHEKTAFRWFVLNTICGWVGFEMIRATWVPLIATSAFIGYTQAKQAWLFQPVAIFSIYGFNLLIILVNVTLAQGLLAWYDHKYRPSEVQVNGGLAKRWLAITGAILAVWIGLSLIMLSSTPNDKPVIRVAALRSGLPLPAFQDEVNTDRVRLETFAGQARDAAARGAQVLFTSEMMFNFDPQQQYSDEFRQIARETNTYIFIAYTVVKKGEPFRNETVMLSPSGQFSAVYAKNHNAPGEPLSPGAGVYPVFDTPFGKMAAMICHDANYTDVSRKLAANGARLIGAGFREFRGFGEQLWTNVTFRAVENHSAIVLTGASYVSAIIDQNGRQIALDASYEGGPLVMVGDVPMGSGSTFYTATGDVLGWAALAGFAFFILFQSITGRRAKKTVSSTTRYQASCEAGMMRKTEIQFSDHEARCVFPDHRDELPQALRELNLEDHYPVIVLVGGFIQDQHKAVTQKAIDVIAACAEENCALIVCGGSDLGVMASIGHTRRVNGYKFPLLGINLKNLVTWPKGPRNKRFLWWGKERFPLSSGYSHFILAPGNEYGADSPWIAEAASLLSKDSKSVTILVNGGSVARKDITLSLEKERPVIVLAGTGRLADEMANQHDKSTLITIIQAENGNALRDVIQLAIGNQN